MTSVCLVQGEPTAEDTLRKLKANRMSYPCLCMHLQMASKGTAAEVGARMFMKRWRARWGARHGRLRLRDDILVAEMQEKARHFGLPGFSFLVVSWAENGLDLGTGFRSPNQDRFPVPIQ